MHLLVAADGAGAGCCSCILNPRQSFKARRCLLRQSANAASNLSDTHTHTRTHTEAQSELYHVTYTRMSLH